MRRWITDPALSSWWGPRGAVEAEITLAQDSDSALCRVLTSGDDAAPVGYAHAVDLALWHADAPAGLPAATWDVDIFVASVETRAADTTQGLRLLVGEVFATTFAVACCALVSVRNEAAARAYEKAGFQWSEIWHDRHAGPSWVMQIERPR